MQNTPLETLTMSELQKLCTDENLPTYGTKSQMIERIKAKALSTVTSELSPVIEVTDSAYNTAVANIVAASEADVKTYAPVNDHAKKVDEILAAIRDAFPRVTVRYNDSDELFTFEGGRQGRVTTTVHQSKPAVLGVARNYYQVMNDGMKPGDNLFNDIGKVG